MFGVSWLKEVPRVSAWVAYSYYVIVVDGVPIVGSMAVVKVGEVGRCCVIGK